MSADDAIPSAARDTDNAAPTHIWRSAQGDWPCWLMDEEQPGDDGRTYVRVRRPEMNEFVKGNEFIGGRWETFPACETFVPKDELVAITQQAEPAEARKLAEAVNTARAISITFFRDCYATTKREEPYTLDALADYIRVADAPTKDELPWLKCAKFGDVRSDQNSLRHDANMVAITGIEADFDSGEVTFDQASEKLALAGIEAILYTSPSHKLITPNNKRGDERLRILCPTSKELPPSQRKHLMGRINSLFRCAVSGESWSDSQSFFYGSVGNNPEHKVQVFHGVPIDQMDELDRIWMGKPQTAAPKANGANGTLHSGRIDEAALRQGILTGDNYHVAGVRLVGAWAQRGMPLMDAQRELEALFDGVFPADRDQRWKDRRDDIARTVLWVYGKEAAKLDEIAQNAPEAPDGFDDNEPPIEAYEGENLDQLPDTKKQGRKAVARLIFRMLRAQAAQAQIEATALAEGARLGLTAAEVYGVAYWVVEKATKGEDMQ
jgi:hypothetical protein